MPKRSLKPTPATLRHLTDQKLDVLAWCNSCDQNAVLALGVLLTKLGAEYPVPAVSRAVRCSECGSKEVSWVVDETGGEVRRIYEQLASQPYQELFFEFLAERRPAPESGFGADYPDSVVVRKVRRAEAEGWGCREDLTAVEIRAFGVEPFWSLKVRASGITLERLELQVSTEWPPARAALIGGTILYRTEGDSGSLELTLVEERCIDAMAGSLFAYRAEVRLGEQILTGCAVTGDGFDGQ